MQNSTEGPLLQEREGFTAKIILNRPEKKNALNNPLLSELVVSLKEAIADDEIRSIVLTGQGACFSSGRDIKEFSGPVGLQDDSLSHTTQPFLQTLTLLLECPKPTIASVRGFALGGGQALTLACDFVVAERGAQFGNVEMAYGFPAAMNIVLLCRHLGRRLGLEIAMTGQTYTAERYQEIGLINRLAEAGDLERATRDFVEVLNSREPWAVRRTKEAFSTAENSTVQGGLYIGDQLNQLLRLSSQSRRVHSQSSDVKESIKATLQNGER
jgi:enoyl-CoA hydratase/carnithine racemase